MRDPGRIDPIIEKLREAWKLEPDWRLGQLIVNICRGPAGTIYDPWHFEEAEWSQWLDAFIERRKEDGVQRDA